MDRPFSRDRRLVTTCTLLGLATFRGPARGGAGDKPAAATSTVRTTTPATGTQFLPPYLQQGTAGRIAFRPAGFCRRMDLSLLDLYNFLGIDCSAIPKGTLAEVGPFLKAESGEGKSRDPGGPAGRRIPSGRLDRHDR